MKNFSGVMVIKFIIAVFKTLNRSTTYTYKDVIFPVQSMKVYGGL